MPECQQALDDLAQRMAGVDRGARQRHPDRTLQCTVTDLGTTFWGRLADGVLVDLTTQAQPPAQIRLAVTSDDLVALTQGRLSFATAWATGRLRVDAGVRDLLRLRSLL